MKHSPSINNSNTRMNVVFTGHVDHGKSSIIGRLLAETNSLPKGKFEQLKRYCELNSRPFEYAFLLDALKDEQAQGITIDSARVFFNSSKRQYIIIDAPGHLEFLKNMISGAARAEAAFLVIDAKEGVRENSKRHGYMLSMLGIKQIAVVINKMDLVNYDKEVFKSIADEFSHFLNNLNIKPAFYLPVSAREGENIALRNGRLKWYQGPSIIEALDNFTSEVPLIEKPFRMHVQDIYKFTSKGDDRRIIAGNIETGKISVGDEIVFYPSGKRSKIKSIESFNTPVQQDAFAGSAVGFTLTEQIYITRGELICKSFEEKPLTGKRIKVKLFWLGNNPLHKGMEYTFKLGTAKVNMVPDEILKVLNSSDLTFKENQSEVNKFDVAECILQLSKAIAFDKTVNITSTSRFVIIDDYEIAGGGLITEVLEDKMKHIRDDVIIRNYRWERSSLSYEQRRKKYNQSAVMVLITGPEGKDRKEIARRLEKTLFKMEKIVYFLGIGNVKYGIDADIKNDEKNSHEHLRRLAEIAHILLDSGMILIVTARDLTTDDIELIKTSISPFELKIVWTGSSASSDIHFDINISGYERIENKIDEIIKLL